MRLQSILRELGEDYSYARFVQRLQVKKQDFNPNQLTGLKQRMDLLETFIDYTGRRQTASRFGAGQLTIVDLSDPFIDPAQACGFFEILVRLFVRAKVDTGKVLVLDEAHKVMSSTTSSGRYTEIVVSIWTPRPEAVNLGSPKRSLRSCANSDIKACG